MGRAPAQLDTSTVIRLREILNNLEDKFELESRPEYSGLVNYSSTSDDRIQRWFRFREGYSPQLVEDLSKDLSRGDLIADPFCGGGATLLAAKKNELRSIGIDINPLAVLLSKVKTKNYSKKQIKRFEEILSTISNLTPNHPDAPKPILSIIDKVFLPEVLRALLVIKHFVNRELSCDDKDFFYLAWLSIIEDVSNVYKEGNGIKYKNRKRTPSGYVEIPIETWQQSMFPEDKFSHVLEKYKDQIELMIKDVTCSTHSPFEPDVFEGDALTLAEFIRHESTSLMCFSPPYANNFNYFKAYKVELWMGDFVTSYADMKTLTRGSLRSHVETSLHRDSDKYAWYPEHLDSLIGLMNPDHLWTDRIPDALRGYFFDMTRVLGEAHDCLVDSGSCAIVVGNSAYGGIIIPTDLLLAEAAEAEGFKVNRIAITRHLTTSSQQKRALEPMKPYLRESILFLTKQSTERRSLSTDNGEIRYRFVSELPNFPRHIPKLVYVIRNQGLTDYTHIIHKYPSKFIPHIPRWAVRKYLDHCDSAVVLDPFVGSGTSLIEASLAGCRSFGIDVDPLARLISKVKTTPIEHDRLESVVDDVIARIESSETSDFRPNISNLDHWFSGESCEQLGIIRESIDKWKDSDKDIYNFLIVCMSSIIRKVSNADNQSLKTYVSGTYPKTPEPVIPLFISTLQKYRDRVLQFSRVKPERGSCEVLEISDSRQYSDKWQKLNLPSVDLIITSPPYIKTIDYVYNQMAEYFWIGDLFGLENQKKQNEYKSRYIGTEKVYANQYRDFDITPGPDQVRKVIEEVTSKNRKHGYIVNQYFMDMQAHLANSLSVLKPGGIYVLVIGDSSISGMQIKTHDLLSVIAKDLGYVEDLIFSYEIRNRYMRFPRSGRGGLVNLDWILTFTRPD